LSHPAAYWQATTDGNVQCLLCPIGCKLQDGQDGLCGTRGNVDGAMVAKQYGRLVSAAVDPIEKKPLYHFFPARSIFSVAALGCNLHCQFCQNWNISQSTQGPTSDTTPEQIVADAQRVESVGIAYTYSEPLVWYEFVRDSARLARAAGLKNVIVSNGFLNPEPLAELLPLIDAANIDLKSMDDEFYKKVCKARLQPVLTNIRAIHAQGVHLEVTNLVIPGQNDSDEQIAELADFVAGVAPDIPLHLSAYCPSYKFTAPPTPPQTLLRARRVAMRRLRYVYLGNVMVEGGADTICPSCQAVAIQRTGYRTVNRVSATGGCPECGTIIPVILN